MNTDSLIAQRNQFLFFTHVFIISFFFYVSVCILNLLQDGEKAAIKIIEIKNHNLHL